MENYKIDIANTRKGCLGGSDGKILQSIAENGNIPKSAIKRLAVCKGLIEVSNPTTRAMEYGDFIEQQVYECLSKSGRGYESNPLWVSDKYSKKNVKLICHPDFLFVDSDRCVMSVFECKATKFSIQDTIENYKAQLFIEQTIAQERACKMGKNWKVKMFLVHYDSSSQDMDDVFVFDEGKLSIREVTMKQQIFDVDKAMTIADEFLDTFDSYSEGDEIGYEYLPQHIQTQFDDFTKAIEEIKEREQRVEAFKSKLYSFMLTHGIKSIKNDSWSITRTEDSVSKSFDYKRYLDDFKAAHPKKAKKIISEYEKEVKRRGSVLIKLKSNNNN